MRKLRRRLFSSIRTKSKIHGFRTLLSNNCFPPYTAEYRLYDIIYIISMAFTPDAFSDLPRPAFQWALIPLPRLVDEPLADGPHARDLGGVSRLCRSRFLPRAIDICPAVTDVSAAVSSQARSEADRSIERIPGTTGATSGSTVFHSHCCTTFRPRAMSVPGTTLGLNDTTPTPGASPAKSRACMTFNSLDALYRASPRSTPAAICICERCTSASSIGSCHVARAIPIRQKASGSCTSLPVITTRPRGTRCGTSGRQWHSAPGD